RFAPPWRIRRNRNMQPTSSARYSASGRAHTERQRTTFSSIQREMDQVKMTRFTMNVKAKTVCQKVFGDTTFFIVDEVTLLDAFDALFVFVHFGHNTWEGGSAGQAGKYHQNALQNRNHCGYAVIQAANLREQGANN